MAVSQWLADDKAPALTTVASVNRYDLDARRPSDSLGYNILRYDMMTTWH